MPKIAPSFLSADFSQLEHQIREVEKSGAEYIHLDVMDGHFVPNISFGPLVVDAVRKKTDLVLDVHLMISYPSQYVQAFADAGADILTVHVEIEENVPSLLGQIQDAGMKPGATLKPGTAIETLFPLLPQLHLALIMSVEPGFGGQSFMPESLVRAQALKTEINRLGVHTEIEIDGGIDVENAREAVQAGVDVLVAGSAAFRGGNIIENVAAIRQAGLG
ncbi:MAG: ribulose-phosphate 3-epimerase [Candidatus Latescibacteria bacterium]|nr:ribulose-phosphate 3-epimerase [Candidatus Latescibacterota bacterium]